MFPKEVILKERKGMITRKEVKKLLPRGAKHLSMGNWHCAFILNGELVSKSYYTLKKEKEDGKERD